MPPISQDSGDTADEAAASKHTPQIVNSPGNQLIVDAEEYADSIILTMPIPLLVLETDLRVRSASHTFYETFRVTPEETEGHLIYELGNGQWNIPELKKLLEEVLPSDQFFVDYEVEHTFEEIGHCTMLLNGRQLDHLQLILLVIFDITKRKQTEVELQNSYDRSEKTLVQLREVQGQLIHQERLAAVGGLAAGIAHDFNNILSIILLHVELGLRVPNHPEKLHAQLEIIAQQSRRAATMVQQILDFGRSAPLQTQEVDLVALLAEQVESLQSHLPQGITIDLKHSDDSYFTTVDPTRVHQIFTNLILNACDAMPNGGKLHIDLMRFQLLEHDNGHLSELELGDWLQISVSDTGTGIEDTALSHLFEPFFTTKDPGKGTGLGLAQVHGLVRQHSGHIDVHTKMGVGTTFVIYLPALAGLQSVSFL